MPCVQIWLGVGDTEKSCVDPIPSKYEASIADSDTLYNLYIYGRGTKFVLFAHKYRERICTHINSVSTFE